MSCRPVLARIIVRKGEGESWRSHCYPAFLGGGRVVLASSPSQACRHLSPPSSTSHLARNTEVLHAIMPVTDQAFVTLATNDIYCQGALVLGQSLRNHGTARKLVVLITAEVTHGIRTALGRVFDEVIEVSTLDSADLEHLALMRRPELGLTFTKLHCWTLTRYSKCVFMDADTLVLCNVDELFDRDELSAAPDSGWPDCFNSGVFVFRPSMETYARLIQFAVEHGSFDGGDQGLLNSFFSDWATTDISKHLPFIYNLSCSSLYTYSPAFRQFGADAKVIHFLGSSKPWHCKYNPQTRTVTEDGSPSGHQHLTFTKLWWEIYTSSVLPLLAGQEEMADTGSQEKHRFGGIEVVMKRERLPPALVPPEPLARRADTDHLDSPTSKIMHNQVREGGSLTSCLLPGCCPTWGLHTSSRGSTSTHRPRATRETPSATASLFQQQLDTSETICPEVPVREASETVPPSSASCVDIPTSEPSSPTSLHSDCQAMFSTDSSLSEPASDTQTWACSSPEPILQESLEPGTLAASVTELSIQVVEEIEPRTEEERRKWEEGQMDYMGKDAFENIKKRLDRFLQ